MIAAFPRVVSIDRESPRPMQGILKGQLICEWLRCRECRNQEGHLGLQLGGNTGGNRFEKVNES